MRRTTTGEGSCVANLGCGPGYEARQLAGLGLNVVGVDLSPAMIASLASRSTCPNAGSPAAAPRG